MKLSMISKSLLPGLALLLTTGAFAAKQTNKGSFNLADPVTLSGHQLTPGQYKLTWSGAGSTVDLNIVSQGKVVATVPAHLVELSSKSTDNATEEHTNDDGTRSLTQIDFAGKQYALAFNNDTTATTSTSQAGSQ
jgi:hypothetical protein